MNEEREILEKKLKDHFDALQNASKAKARKQFHELDYSLDYQNLLKAGFRQFQLPSRMRGKNAYAGGHAKA